MNRLLGKITWDAAKGLPLEQGADLFRNGELELRAERVHSFDFDPDAYFYNKDSRILCAMVGYLNNIDEIKGKYKFENKNDVEIIERLFRLKGKAIPGELDGIFSVFIYDENAQKAYLFQDEYGSSLPVYYANSGKGLVFSTSLKAILKNIGTPRELNFAAVQDLLYFKTMIPNEATLIRGVSKLPPKRMLEVDLKSGVVGTGSWAKDAEQAPLSRAKARLIGSIENNLSGIFKHLAVEKLALTLSSGYDSNFILYALRKLTSKKIAAITIGGKEANEIPGATLLASAHKDVAHNPKVIDSSIINSFPDIVWRTEGYVFEQGLFLQYELSRTLAENNIQSLFVGECADQVLNTCRYSKYKLFREAIAGMVKRTFLGNLYYCFFKRKVVGMLSMEPISGIKKLEHKSQYNVEFDYILKKNGIMLNSFGRQGLYVFINKETAALSKALGKLNVGKGFYKEELKKIFPEAIRSGIAKGKIGGSTDILYLFHRGEKEIAEILRSGFVKGLFSQAKIRKMQNNPGDYCILVFRIVYLYLFRELFISGKYDPLFDQEGISFPLASFTS